MLEVGMRVRILVPFEDGVYREGIIYECCPGRPWPWHVLVDGWSEKWGGVAFAGEELEALWMECSEEEAMRRHRLCSKWV